LNKSKRITVFKDDQCNLCGLCFHLCPVLTLPIEVAKEEIKNLIENKESKIVLSKCNSCFSCNLYCPQQANPYQLILESWNKLYAKRGAPPLYRFVCPTEVPNIWQLLNLFLSNQEKKWIGGWMRNVPNSKDNVLLIGNYTHLFPFIIGGSKLLSFFKPVDLIDQWEGGAYLYQGGYLDVVNRIAMKTKRDFDNRDLKNITILTDSVQFLFKEVHPKEMGIQYNQKFINFNEWLLDNIREGKIKLSKAPLDMSVTVHDNCYSKTLNGQYWDNPRKILYECGCKILEMEHNKKDSLCCGFGAGASWVKNISIPFDIISEGVKKFQEAEKTGAKALISYCSGCIYLLWATRELTGRKIDIFHLIEVVRLAMGEKLNYPNDHKKRAWDVIAIITYSLLLSIFSKKFFINKLSYDKELSSFKPRKHLLLKLIRYLFNISLIRFLYSKMFQIMMPIMRTK